MMTYNQWFFSRARQSRPVLISVAAMAFSCNTSSPRLQPASSPTAAESQRNAPIQALPVTPNLTRAADTDDNPLVGAEIYVNPAYQRKIEQTVAAHPEEAALLSKARGYPTGLWVDSIEATDGIPEHLQRAQELSVEKGRPVIPLFVVYDLPNRDCAAKASGGELKSEEAGEERYRKEFIGTIARHFRSFPDQQALVVLEPDSLPNVVTNLNVPLCAASEELYKHSVAYAVAQLSLPNVHLYLDAAHSGWLGWDGNRTRMANVFKEVLDLAGGPHLIRGFATNVSNYTPLDGADGKRLEPSNPCPDELSYVARLNESLQEVGIDNKGFLIDTSRNGRGGIRKAWGSWCNVRGAGLGERPSVAPAALIDAYVWIKPPGESDGIADPAAARFDESCASPDSTPGAPEAGEWFESYFIELSRNAAPSL